LEFLFGDEFNYHDFNYQDIKDTLVVMTKMSERNSSGGVGKAGKIGR